MVANDWLEKPDPFDWRQTVVEPRLGPQPQVADHVDIQTMVNTAIDRSRELTKGGARFDAGKSRVDLIPAHILLMLGEIYEMGARKYDASNWRKGMKWSKVYGPLLRHLFTAWGNPEQLDKESGKPHIMHAVWNVIALAYYMTRPEYARFDDRQDVVNLVDMPEEERQQLYV